MPKHDVKTLASKRADDLPDPDDLPDELSDESADELPDDVADEPADKLEDDLAEDSADDAEESDSDEDDADSDEDDTGPSFWSGHLRWWVAAVVAVVLIAAGATTWLLLRPQQLPADAAFKIDGTIVTKKQVDVRMKELHALYGVQIPTTATKLASFRRDTAKSMAVQRVLEDEASKRKLVVPQKDVTDTLNTLIQQRYPSGGRQAFVAALGDMGATQKQVTDEISSQLLVSRLFDAVAGDASVTETQIRQAFNQRKTTLGTPESRTIRNIVVADRPTAVQVLDRLRAGESFTKLVPEVSLDEATRTKGGLLGNVTKSDLTGGYATTAFKAHEGVPFGPVKTKYGWNVGLVTKVQPAKAAVYKTVHDSLRLELIGEKSMTTWRSWLAAVLRSHKVDYAASYRPAQPYAVPNVDDVSSTPATTGQSTN